MGTGATLATLIQEVQYELGHSVSSGVGQNFRNHIANRIRREYKRLYDDFTWPHLITWVDLTLVGGTNVYQLPQVSSVQVRLDNLIGVYALFGNQYTEVDRGVAVTDYNGLNSDLGQKADPVQKWRATDETHIEVWPKPASAGSLRLVVKKPFVQLADETSTCALDDELVVMHAAAEYLARQGSKEAPAVTVRAEAYYKSMRQRLQAGANKASLLPSCEPAYDPRRKVFVGVTGTP